MLGEILVPAGIMAFEVVESMHVVVEEPRSRYAIVGVARLEAWEVSSSSSVLDVGLWETEAPSS